MVSKLVFDNFELNAENFLRGVTYKNSVNAEKDLHFRTVGMSSINFEVLSSTLSQTAKEGLVEGATCKYYYKYGITETQSISVTNIIKNGNFADATNWDGSIQSINNNIATTTWLYQSISLSDANKYYISFRVRSDVENNSISVFTSSYNSGSIEVGNTWKRVSLIDNIKGSSINFVSDPFISFEIKDVIIVNLTADGLENKTVSELDELMPEYFSGTKTFNTYSEEGVFSEGKTYTIKEVEKIRDKIRISAYDDLHRFDVDVSGWLNGLTYPKLLSALFTELCTHIGLTSTYSALPNISFSVKKNIEAQEISGRIVLQFISELTNAFVYVGNDRKVRLATYQDKGATLDNTKYTRFSRADYRVSKIDKVQIKSAEYDIGSIHGDGENALVINENPFAYAETSGELNPITQNIYNNIKNFDYFPFEIELFQDFGIEVGDVITINGEETIVMEKTIKPAGVTLSATGEKTRGTQVSLVNYEFTRLRGIKHEVFNTIDGFESRITTAEGTVTTLSNTVSGFENRITDAEGNVTSLSTTVGGFETRISTVEGYGSRITQTENNIALVVGSGKLVGSGGAVNASVVVSAINNDSSVTINANRINLTGYVTVTSLSTSGATTINGDNITTGTLNANLIKTGTLTLGGPGEDYATLTLRRAYTNKLAFQLDHDGMKFYNTLDEYVTQISSTYGYITTTGIGFGKVSYSGNTQYIENMGNLTYGTSDGIYLSSVNKLKITSGTNMSIDSLNHYGTGVVHICTSTESTHPQQLIMGTDVSGYRTKIYLKGDVYVNGTLLPY